MSEREDPSRPLTALLDQGPDRELVTRVGYHIWRLHGNQVDVSELSTEVRTVNLVTSTVAIVFNGGFNYLLESSFEGDPDFTLTLQAFRDLDCKPAIEAVERVFALFPHGRVPTDPGRRLRIYRRGTGELRQSTESQLCAAEEEIDHCLASYVRAHRDVFEALASAPADRSPKPKPEPDSKAADDPLDELASLPHWARVAFAGQCAASVLPMFPKAWPNAAPKYQNAVVQAGTLARQSAAQARPVRGLDQAPWRACMTAGAALATVYGMDPSPGEVYPPDGNAGATASCIAKVAEKAAEAALAKPAESTRPALEAWTYTVDLLQDNDQDDKITDLRRTFDLLAKLSRSRGWTDRAPVPSTVFKQDPGADELEDRPWWKFW